MRERIGPAPKLNGGDNFDESDMLAPGSRNSTNAAQSGLTSAATSSYRDVVRKYSEKFERFSDRQRSDVERVIQHAEKNRRSWERAFGKGDADRFISDSIALIEGGISADEILTGRRP
jgi:hypothetical protein